MSSTLNIIKSKLNREEEAEEKNEKQEPPKLSRIEELKQKLA